MLHSLTLILTLAFAPSLALLWFFYHKDRYEPEPKKYVVLLFILGAFLAFFLLTLMQSFIFPLINEYFLTAVTLNILLTALVIGIIEEPLKGIFLRIPYSSKEMLGIMDGVVYGVSIGLGFASVENFLYGIGYEGANISVERAILNPIAQSVWAATIGVGYGLRAERELESKKGAGFRKGGEVIHFLLIAIFLHFLWNFTIVIAGDNYQYYGIVVAIILFNLYIISYFLKSGIIEDKGRYGS